MILLSCVGSAVAVITLIFAVFLLVEGISLCVGALRLRAHSGWVWTLLSGLASFVLGVMIYVRWPSDSAWVLGSIFGINLIFNASSVLALALAAPKAADR